MVKVRKKPVILEAIRWTGENFDELRLWGGEDISRREGHDTELQVEEGDWGGYCFALIGDWIVKDHAWKFSTYPPGGFEEVYEIVK